MAEATSLVRKARIERALAESTVRLQGELNDQVVVLGDYNGFTDFFLWSFINCA